MTNLNENNLNSPLEISESLNLGITEKDLLEGETLKATLIENTLEIEYVDMYILSLVFKLDENRKIVGINSCEGKGVGIPHIYLRPDQSILLGRRQLKVLYGDDELEVDNDTSIHISKLIKYLILNRHGSY